MIHFFRNKNFFIMLAGETLLFALALFLAYGLRFEFEIPANFFRQMLGLLPLGIGLKLAFFFIFGLYRGMWRYTGLADLWRIGQALVMAEIILVLSLVFVRNFYGFPRSIFVLDPLLAFVLACGARVLIRQAHEFSTRSETWPAIFFPWRKSCDQRQTRALILGADDEAARMAKEILASAQSGMSLLGFVDDDPRRIGRQIHGLPVHGPMADLTGLARKLGVNEILISATVADSQQTRSILAACEQAQIKLKKLPALPDIVSGKVSIKALRDVRYEDLLGRAEVRLDRAGIADCLQGKVVLVTGAGGSIGSELCRQIVRFAPRELVLVDAGEENLYALEMELKHQLGYPTYVPILGQVQDAALMESVLQNHRPAVVFHAAAYKHVPMLEINPWQAVTNNILGSRTVMELSARYGVERFVLVSTDKAVRPTNVMGASKRVAERLMLGLSAGRTKFMAVRFGNVLGSSGSVIPLFRSQIERGGPVTVTHPEVTRFFMTIPEAAQLIIQAAALGNGREIFVLKMGQPVRIVDLARDLIVLSGKDPLDIPVIFTGLRPGEKLYEELITEGEGVLETGHDQILVLGSESACATRVQDGLDDLLAAAARFDTAKIKCLLGQMVPEYAPAPDAAQDS